MHTVVSTKLMRLAQASAMPFRLFARAARLCVFSATGAAHAALSAEDLAKAGAEPGRQPDRRAAPEQFFKDGDLN